jgi:type IV secretion system protein VirB6
MEQAMSSTASDLLLSVDVLGTAFIRDVYQPLGRVLQPIFFTMLILYVIWWGFSLITGRASLSPIEAMERLLRAVVIYWLATSWGALSGTIYAAIQSIPDVVGSRIMAGIALATGRPASSDVLNALDMIYATSIRIAGQIYIGSVMDSLAGLLSALVIVFSIAFLGIAIASVFAAKLFLQILVAIGPLWIVLALYKYSSRYTDGFLAIVVRLLIQQVLIFAFLGFYSGIITLAIGATDVTTSVDVTLGMSHIMPLLLVEAVGCYLLIQVPGIARTIADGTSMMAGRHGIATVNAIDQLFRTKTQRVTMMPSQTDETMRNIQRETARNATVRL